MPLIKHNLFVNLPPALPAEVCQTIIQTPQVIIERIISTGQQSPEGYWYDQAQAEWVIVLQGQAQLEFADHVETLTPGDYINIGAHVKHRVKWTTPDQATIWLAIFYSETAGEII